MTGPWLKHERGAGGNTCFASSRPCPPGTSGGTGRSWSVVGTTTLVGTTTTAVAGADAPPLVGRRDFSGGAGLQPGPEEIGMVHFDPEETGMEHFDPEDGRIRYQLWS